ncbi:MAG: hypothetical protein AB7D27_06915 [Desulfomicrobium sp.]
MEARTFIPHHRKELTHNASHSFRSKTHAQFKKMPMATYAALKAQLTSPPRRGEFSALARRFFVMAA